MDTPYDKAAICSWMYMRNVSLCQRPILRMVSCGIPLMYIAMAPPARRLCDPIRFGVKPCLWRPRVVTARWSAFVISALVIWRRPV